VTCHAHDSCDARTIHSRSLALVDYFLARTSNDAVADTPFREAVIVNDRLLVTERALTRNMADDAPAATLTAAGTAKARSSAARVTVELPVALPAERVTVQVEVARDKIREGEHWTLETVGRMLMPPPVPETVRGVPPARAPATSPIDSSTVGALVIGASLTVITATTPLLIGFASILVARHRAEPLPDLQLSHLPAAVRAGPVVKVSDAMSLVIYDSVHCRLDGALPANAFKERLKDAEPPWTAEPDDSFREVV